MCTGYGYIKYSLIELLYPNLGTVVGKSYDILRFALHIYSTLFQVRR
jgi:hypothetical protein